MSVCIEVYQDRHLGMIQVSIGLKGGRGYRILGPKFTGSSELLASEELDARDADEIRSYLDKVADADSNGGTT